MPTITLNGDNTVFVPLNGTYTEEGVTVVDNCDKDLTSDVNITNMIDTTKVGDYQVKYKVKDKSNNKSTITKKYKSKRKFNP